MQLVSKMLGKELDDMSDIKGEQKAFEKSKSDEPVLRQKDCIAMQVSSHLISISKR